MPAHERIRLEACVALESNSLRALAHGWKLWNMQSMESSDHPLFRLPMVVGPRGFASQIPTKRNQSRVGFLAIERSLSCSFIAVYALLTAFLSTSEQIRSQNSR